MQDLILFTKMANDFGDHPGEPIVSKAITVARPSSTVQFGLLTNQTGNPKVHGYVLLFITHVLTTTSTKNNKTYTTNNRVPPSHF